MTDDWVRHIHVGGGEFVEAGPLLGLSQQEAVRLQKVEALRAEARKEERRQQAGLNELIHGIAHIVGDGDAESARELIQLAARLPLPPETQCQVAQALQAFIAASKQLAEAQTALVKATTPPLRVGDLRINLQVDRDALITAREMVKRLAAEQHPELHIPPAPEALSPQAAAIWEAFRRPGTVQLLDNAGILVSAATLRAITPIPSFFPLLQEALRCAAEPVAAAQRVIDSFASVASAASVASVEANQVRIGPEGIQVNGTLVFPVQPAPPTPPELVVEPHEQAIAVAPDERAQQRLGLTQAIDARLEAARATGRHVNVLEVGGVEFDLLGQTTGYNHMLSDGETIGLTVRRIDREAALSVYYDPEA